ncbi:hypothetical protein [Erwinia aphidicola]|uniref:hypothetical protein n=1 Tax=Erwinia aphidicola TaxID=68334 RepID=UPI003D251BB9
MLWSVWLAGRKKIVLAKQIRALTGQIPEGRFIDLFFCPLITSLICCTIFQCAPGKGAFNILTVSDFNPLNRGKIFGFFTRSFGTVNEDISFNQCKGFKTETKLWPVFVEH